MRFGDFYGIRDSPPVVSQFMQHGGSLKRTTAPDIDPVNVDYVKLIGSITISDDDALLSKYITSATRYLENHLGRAFITQTWNWTRGINNLQIRNPIPRPPLQVINEISYTDTLGNKTVIDDDYYTVDTDNEPGIVWLKTSWVWPWPITQMNAYFAYYTLDFDCGYGDDADDVPQPIIDSITNIVVFWYENRGMLPVPDSITDVLTPYRIFQFKI